MTYIVYFLQQSTVVFTLNVLVWKRPYYSYIGEYLGGQWGGKGSAVRMLFLVFFNVLHDEQHQKRYNRSQHDYQESKLPSYQPKEKQTPQKLQ